LRIENEELRRSDWLLIAGSGLTVVLAGLTRYAGGGSIVALLCSGVSIALLAALVSRSLDALGDRFGPGATGVLQSGLGNLPEFFISIFALRDGLVELVRAALIGSILSNLLLVLGLAFLCGGLKHGPQRLNSARARGVTVLMVLSVAALVLPSLASYIHTPAAPHEPELSAVASVILLILFVLTLPASLRKHTTGLSGNEHHGAGPRWSLKVAIGMLAASSVAAAVVSDWFIAALQPAMQALHISEAFAGLVIVAIASNAVEHAVGIQLAWRNESEYAFSVIINSPLQIALVLAPLLVLVSELFGLATLTLVFSPMLVVSVAIAVILTAFITFDGESDWIEGAALVALYVIIATTFWWG
jgi:Ca2+:H+ antiporter